MADLLYPTMPGEWRYKTVCINTEDAGLHGKEGKFTAASAEGDNPLYVHGGILKVSSNKRYLTYSDGTPFFWLGDTWWFCPSDLVPLRGSTYPKYDSMYKALIDRRKSQGFSIAQMAFLGSSGVINNLVNSSVSSGLRDESIEYWQEIDEYIMYANEAGIIPVIGLAFHTGMDQLSLEQWKSVWQYAIARYSAFAVTWLITGEYNLDNVPERVEKVMALGQAIRHGLHRDDRCAWCWFIMRMGQPVRLYHDPGARFRASNPACLLNPSLNTCNQKTQTSIGV